jgi:hypothetical protein
MRYVVIDPYGLDDLPANASVEVLPLVVDADSYAAAVMEYCNQGRLEDYDIPYGETTELLVLNPKTLVCKRFKVQAPDVRFKVTEVK